MTQAANNSTVGVHDARLVNNFRQYYICINSRTGMSKACFARKQQFCKMVVTSSAWTESHHRQNKNERERPLTLKGVSVLDQGFL